jgi:hypothetical protein
MISIPKSLATARALARPIGDEIFDAVGTKRVSTQLHRRVPDIAIANGADGDFL